AVRLRLGQGREHAFFFRSRHFLKLICNRRLFYIHLATEHVFKTFDCGRKRLQVNGFSRREARRFERSVVDQWSSSLRLLVIAIAATLMCDLNTTGTEQNGENKTNHISFPSISDPTEIICDLATRHLVA